MEQSSTRTITGNEKTRSRENTRASIDFEVSSSFGSETVEGTVCVVNARRRVGIRLDKSGYARAEGKTSISTFAIRDI